MSRKYIWEKRGILVELCFYFLGRNNEVKEKREKKVCSIYVSFGSIFLISEGLVFRRTNEQSFVIDIQSIFWGGRRKNRSTIYFKDSRLDSENMSLLHIKDCSILDALYLARVDLKRVDNKSMKNSTFFIREDESFLLPAMISHFCEGGVVDKHLLEKDISFQTSDEKRRRVIPNLLGNAILPICHVRVGEFPMKWSPNVNLQKGVYFEDLNLKRLGGEDVGSDNAYGGADLKYGDDYFQLKCYKDEASLVEKLIEKNKACENYRKFKYEIGSDGEPLGKYDRSHELNDPSKSLGRSPMKVMVSRNLDPEDLVERLERKGLDTRDLEIVVSPFSNKFCTKACSPFTFQSIISDVYLMYKPPSKMEIAGNLFLSFGVETTMGVISGMIRGENTKTIARNVCGNIPKIVAKSAGRIIMGEIGKIGGIVFKGQLQRILKGSVIPTMTKFMGQSVFTNAFSSFSLFGLELVPVIVTTGTPIALGYIFGASRLVKGYITGDLTLREALKEGILMTSDALIQLITTVTGNFVGSRIGEIVALAIGGVPLLQGLAPFLPGVGSMIGCFGGRVAGFILQTFVRKILDVLIKIPDYVAMYHPVFRDEFARVVFDEFGNFLTKENEKDITDLYNEGSEKFHNSVVVRRLMRKGSYVEVKKQIRERVRTELRIIMFSKFLKGVFDPKNFYKALPDPEEILDEIQFTVIEEVTDEVNRIGKSQCMIEKVVDSEDLWGGKFSEEEDEGEILEDSLTGSLLSEVEGTPSSSTFFDVKRPNSEVFTLLVGNRLLIYRVNPVWGLCVLERFGLRKYDHVKKILRLDPKVGVVVFCVETGKVVVLNVYNVLEDDLCESREIEIRGRKIVVPTPFRDKEDDQNFGNSKLFFYDEKVVFSFDVLTREKKLLMTDDGYGERVIDVLKYEVKKGEKYNVAISVFGIPHVEVVELVVSEGIVTRRDLYDVERGYLGVKSSFLSYGTDLRYNNSGSITIALNDDKEQRIVQIRSYGEKIGCSLILSDGWNNNPVNIIKSLHDVVLFRKGNEYEVRRRKYDGIWTTSWNYFEQKGTTSRLTRSLLLTSGNFFVGMKGYVVQFDSFGVEKNSLSLGKGKISLSESVDGKFLFCVCGGRLFALRRNKVVEVSDDQPIFKENGLKLKGEAFF